MTIGNEGIIVGTMPVLIVTRETSDIDRYSQELDKRLNVRIIETRRHLSLAKSYRLARLINAQGDIVHLPNQNFARRKRCERSHQHRSPSGLLPDAKQRQITGIPEPGYPPFL